MTLNVQNSIGTIASANSYVTVQDFKDYWTARSVDYTALTDAVIESYLIPAASYLDSRFEFDGYKSNGRDQATAFPRENLYDDSGEEPVLVAGIPREVKESQHEYAHIFAVNGSLQSNGSTSGNIKRVKKKVGPLEREFEYSPPGESGSVISYPVADNKIPQCFIAAFSMAGMATHV